MWRYVKSGYGGPPSLWRPLHPAQHGAGQSDSHAPQAPRSADCRPSSSSIPKAPSRRSRQARSTAPACVRFGLSRFLQAKRACRASPPLLASRCSEENPYHVMAANRPAGVPARRIFRYSPGYAGLLPKTNPHARSALLSRTTTIGHPQNKPGQGSRTATLRRLRTLPTAAPRSQPYINSNFQADAKADYRIRSTNIIPVLQKSALDYKSALVFR